MKIFETNKINLEELATTIKSVDLVLVDIDDVLLTTPQYFCGHIWYSNHINSKELDLIKSLRACREKTDYIPLDTGLIDILNESSQLQHVFALTGRPVETQNVTEYFFDKYQISLTKLEIDLYSEDNEQIFKSGVIYTGNNSEKNIFSYNKGNILERFLETYNEEVKSILFIDDVKQNIIDVANACEEKNIDLNAIYFTQIESSYIEKKITADFLEAIGNIQYNYFFENNGIILSDEQALQIFLDGQI